MVTATQILIVDDDPRLCRTLGRYLSEEGYGVYMANNGEEMRQHMAQDSPNLVILDVKLPGEDGFTLARELRSRYDVGIIMLTVKDNTVDKIVGLEVGADDYLTKPFEERELLARIRSVLRRTSRTPTDTAASETGSIARFAGWTMDLAAQELTSPAGKEIHLTGYEFSLLAGLVRNPNRVLNRDQMLDFVAGREWSPLDRSIDVLVRKLRKKLEDNPQNPSLIKTVRGTGYKFVARVEFE